MELEVSGGSDVASLFPGSAGADHPSTSVGMAQHMGGLGSRDPGLPRSTKLDLSLPRVLPVIPDMRSGSNNLRSTGFSLGPIASAR